MTMARISIGRSAFLWLALAGVTSARDLHVDNVGGDDRNDGSTSVATGTLTGPCRTIARALQLARAGDHIFLANRGEPYRESVTLQGGRHSGTNRERFEIHGQGATLDGRAELERATWSKADEDIYRWRPAHATFPLLYLEGKPLPRRPATADGLPDLKNLAPLEWLAHGGEVYFRTDPLRLPHQYALSYPHLPVAITLYEVRNVVIRDLVIQGYRVDGVSAHDSARGIELSALTVRGNGRSGVHVGGSSRVRLDGCLIGDNGSAQVQVDQYAGVQLDNCTLLDRVAPAIVDLGGKVERSP